MNCHRHRTLHPMLTADVLNLIGRERRQQDHTWGEQNHPDGTGREFDEDMAIYARTLTDYNAKHGALTWRDILNEEVAEAFAETDLKKLRAELIQVAAVAAAWIEHIDRRPS